MTTRMRRLIVAASAVVLTFTLSGCSGLMEHHKSDKGMGDAPKPHAVDMVTG